MSTEVKNKKVCDMVILTLCSLGLLIQINEVSVQYFAFETRSRVYVTPHFNIKIPTLSACLRIVDIINLTSVENDHKLRLINQDKSVNWTAEKMFSRTVPLKYIWKETPSIDQVFEEGNESCRIRLPDEDFIEYSNVSNCYKKFDVTKYFHRESICYKFSPNYQTRTLEVEHYMLTDEAYGMIYLIRLNSLLFQRVIVVSSYVHDDDSFPLYDALFAQYVIVGSYAAELMPSFNTLNLVRLEPPYDTKCYPYPPRTGQFDLIMNRISDQTRKQLGLVSPKVMVYEDEIDDQMTILTSPALKVNISVRESFRKIQKSNTFSDRQSCFVRCLISKLRTGNSKRLTFRVTWPDGFLVDIEYQKKIVVIDLIIYVCSCIGIWFGISVFSSFHLIWNFILNRKERNRSHPGTTSQPSATTMTSNEQFLMKEIRRIQFTNDRRYRDLGRTLHVVLKRAKHEESL